MRYWVLLLAFLIAIPAGAQKKGKTKKQVVQVTTPQEDVEPPKPYSEPNEDFERYIREYNPVKGEFEKTVEFQRRLEEYANNKQIICVMMPESSEKGRTTTYDADSEILSIVAGFPYDTGLEETTYATDSSVLFLGLKSDKNEYTVTFKKYAAVITNSKKVSDLGITFQGGKYSTVIHGLKIPTNSAADAKFWYRLVLCLKMGGQEKTRYIYKYQNKLDEIDNKLYSSMFFIAPAEIVGFKIVNVQNDKVILEKYLPQ